MLYSPAANLGFAHYPKTAGHSLVEWFRGAFPDARFVVPDAKYPISHMSVRESLERLGHIPRRSRTLIRAHRNLTPIFSMLQTSTVRKSRCEMRIFGVLREPFEMLDSLYKYWRSYTFDVEPDSLLIRSARTGSFRDFLAVAVGERMLPRYEDFFDVGGPAWPTTRLLDFSNLALALAAVCREFDVAPPPESLSRRNVGPPARRDAGGPLLDAGPMAFAVRSHFDWYYRHGVRMMIRGDHDTRRRRCA